MSGFTIAWIVWGVAFAIIEGIALFNSRRGDTLSEHVWAWIGVGPHRTAHCRYCGEWITRLGKSNSWIHTSVAPVDPHLATPALVTAKWTLRLARLAVAILLVWLAGHFLTGGTLW